MEEITGMKPMERDLKRNNLGKMALGKKIPGEKVNKEISPEEKALGGGFR